MQPSSTEQFKHCRLFTQSQSTQEKNQNLQKNQNKPKTKRIQPLNLGATRRNSQLIKFSTIEDGLQSNQQTQHSKPNKERDGGILKIFFDQQKTT